MRLLCAGLAVLVAAGCASAPTTVSSSAAPSPDSLATAPLTSSPPAVLTSPVAPSTHSRSTPAASTTASIRSSRRRATWSPATTRCHVGSGYPTGAAEVDGFTFTLPDPPPGPGSVVSPDVAVAASAHSGPDAHGAGPPTCFLVAAESTALRKIPSLTEISGRTITPAAEPSEPHLVWAVVRTGVLIEAAGPAGFTRTEPPPTGTGIWIVDARTGRALGAVDFG